jgi:uncharacterized membrane protein
MSHHEHGPTEAMIIESQQQQEADRSRMCWYARYEWPAIVGCLVVCVVLGALLYRILWATSAQFAAVAISIFLALCWLIFAIAWHGRASTPLDEREQRSRQEICRDS